RPVATDAIAIANGHVQVSVGTEDHAPREVATGLPCVGHEDVLHVDEFRPIEATSRDRERRTLLTLLRIGEVHELVLRELRVERDEVEQISSASAATAPGPAALR